MKNNLSTIISTSIIWIILIVSAIMLAPSILNPPPSEIIQVQVTNSTSEPIRAAFFLSDGTTVGSEISAASDAQFTLFEGELSNPKAPNSVRVLIAGDGTDIILNTPFSITKSSSGIITHPASFEIKDPAEGETEKRVKFVIRGKTSP